MLFKRCFLFLAAADAAFAIKIYLNPQPAVLRKSGVPTLSPSQARAFVSHQLGLAQFDSLQDAKGVEHLLSGSFVGGGDKNSLLLTLSDEVVRDVVPNTFKPSFSVLDPVSLQSEMNLVVSSYTQRAQHVYSTIISSEYSDSNTPHPNIPGIIDIFSAHPSDSTELYLSETAKLVSVVESGESDVFGAFSLSGLSAIRADFGSKSELYRLAAETLRAVLTSAISKSEINLVLLTYSSSSSHVARQDQIQPPEQSPLPIPSPQLPLSGTTTCFTDAESCANNTSSCSGHGECVQATKAGRTCFVCTCLSTRDESGRKTDWAGEQCERQDISSSFVLLAGTVIGILVVIIGSVSLLYSVGSQELPSTLVAGALGHAKRD